MTGALPRSASRLQETFPAASSGWNRFWGACDRRAAMREK
jgi:hypothetical protein